MKKTCIKILSVALCAVMVLGAAPLGGLVGIELPSFFDFKAEAATYSGKCGTNLTWSLDTSTGVLNITGTGAMTNYSSSSDVPWYSYHSKIKTANIASGVTTIGMHAFCYCTSLTSVKIGNSVTTIGDGAFFECGSLTSVTIPDSVTTIGEWAFFDCDSLTSVTIPDSVTTIGVFAFYSCDSLTSVTIGNSVTSIGYNAFVVCYDLTSIIVDENNKNYSSDSYGVLFNKDKTELIQYPIGNARTSYTIPNSVTTIGNSAFKACDSLTSVTIPDSVTRIGYDAFEYCDSLTSVTIPDSVTTIGDYAFYSCSSLTSVTIGNSVTSIGNYTFYSCDNLTDVYYTGTEAQWKKIAIDSDNDSLKNATIHYNHIHKLNNVIESVDPTCYKTGYKTGTCVCGYGVITEEIPALNHKDTLVKVEAKAPTCTEIGWDAYEYCTACTYTTYVEKAALKHDIIIDKAVDATCTETGLTEGQHCSRCDGATIKQDVVPALNHKDTLVKVVAKAPTCTEIGWDAYEYCTACTYTTYAEKPALKHDIIIDKAVDATCTETGLTEGQHCSRCDDMTVKQEVVPVKAHNHTAKYDSAKHWEECVCGSKTNIQNHTFVGGNVCSCGFKRTVDSTIKIKNNSGAKTINYGETLMLMSTVTDKPENAKIYWYVDGEQKGEGEIFEVKFESGTKIITVKLVDENGVVYQSANGEEISESENVTVNAGFFQKLISFFKNLFRMNRTIVQ